MQKDVLEKRGWGKATVNFLPFALACFFLFDEDILLFVSLFAFNFLPWPNYRNGGMVIGIISKGQLISE